MCTGAADWLHGVGFSHLLTQICDEYTRLMVGAFLYIHLGMGFFRVAEEIRS